MNEPHPPADAGEFDPFAGPALSRVVPTTEAQREVWLADQLGPEASLAYNESISIRLRGALDIDVLRGALGDLVTRHDSLRATVGSDGLELLIAESIELPFEAVDLSALDPAARDAAVAKHLAAAVETPFDVARGPLVRAVLLTLGKDDHRLLFTAHHIVCDGWSFGVLCRDLAALYAARATGAAAALPPADDYGAYALDEVQERDRPSFAAAEQFWLQRFDGGAPALELPCDRPRPARRAFSSRREDVVLDAALVDSLKRLAGRSGASLFGVLLTAFGAMLSRLSGAAEVVVGVPAAGQSAAGMANLVGHCVNLLPIKLDFDPQEPASAVLRRAQSQLLDAFEHQRYTFGTLLRKLRVERDPSRLPLVSVMFNLDQRLDGNSLGFPALDVEVSSNPRHFENFELFVNAVQSGGALRLECQYNMALFDAASVRGWISAFETLLRGLVENAERPLGRLDLTSPAEKRRLATWNSSSAAAGKASNIPDALQAAGPFDGSAVAVVCAGRTLSRAELQRRSNRLANFLRARGAQRGKLVGIHLPRDERLLITQLAVLKSGAAYVPLDPAYPSDRLAYMVADSGLQLLLSDGSHAASLGPSVDTVPFDANDAAFADESDAPLTPDAGRDARSDDPAYVIYTSGSTGKPKGVVVPHGAVVNFLHSMSREPGLTSSDCLLAVTTLSFDIAVLELLLPQLLGARIVLATRDETLDGPALTALLERHHVTAMQATPATWRLLIDAGWTGSPGFKALVGGEALPPDLAAQLLQRAEALWNMYGPTETTVWSTTCRIDRADQGISIGRPIANTQVWVLDEARQLCPPGFPGELCIGGAGVSLGYLNRPELTADRFIADPYSDTPSRLYRTGDRGRWRQDGLLEHLGRLDTQVKLRGFRIELGEIEATLSAHPRIAQSVVIVREDQPGDLRMVGYVVPREGEVDLPLLLAHLRQTLPEYMIPQHIVTIERIPLLANGKVDRRGLPPPASDLSRNAESLAPRDEIERLTLEAMEQVLNLQGLGIRDDFFLFGGHSLLASRLAVKLGSIFEVRLPMRTMFEASTAERLAQAVRSLRSEGGPAREPLVHDGTRRDAPLTLMQERIRFIEEMHPGRVVYNTPSAHRLDGPMDVAAFERAFQKLLARQPVLRTALVHDKGEWLQRTVETVDVSLLPLEDLSGVAADQRDAVLKRRLEELIDQVIDLGQAPLFRCRLFKLGEDSHLFFFMAHHIIWDGWSFDLLYEEMSTLYAAELAGRQDTRAPLAITYGDFAVWHRRWIESAECAAQLDYWRRQFGEGQGPIDAPIDRPRRAGMSGSGGTEWIAIDESLTSRLHEVARLTGTTLNMTLLAAFVAMASRVLGSSAPIVGVPVRGRLMSELEPVMGFFNNLLPVRLGVDQAAPFAGLAREVKRRLLEAFEHQDVPFELVSSTLERSERSVQANLYDVLFSFQDVRQRRFDWAGLKHTRTPVHQKGATEDLGLWLVETPAGLRGGVTYNRDVILTATAQLLRDRYVALLGALADRPDCTVRDLLRMTDSERRLIGQWSSGSAIPSGEPFAAPLDAGDPALAAAAAALDDRGAAGASARLVGPRLAAALALSPTDAFLAFPERPVAATAAEMVAARVVGASIRVAQAGLARDGDALRDALERDGFTIMSATPLTWRLLLDAWWTARPGFRALVDVTEASQGLVDALIQAGCRVVGVLRDPANGLPLAAGELTADDGLHCGTPLAPDLVAVVDAERDWVAACVPGQLALGPARTPLGGRARWRGDGCLQILDTSGALHFNGKRYSTAEVEAALTRAAGGARCAVVVREPRPGERRLVVFTEAGADAAAAGRQWLAGLGIDADWQQLPTLPTDANGQVDRRTLTVDAAGAGSRPTRRDPVTPTEKTLAAIWAELLSVRQIDSADNFFSLGGTSLLAMQAAERMKAATGRSVHARRFVFESLAQLALAYDTEGAPSTAPESAPPPEQGSFLSRVASRWKKKG